MRVNISKDGCVFKALTGMGYVDQPKAIECSTIIFIDPTGHGTLMLLIDNEYLVATKHVESIE